MLFSIKKREIFLKSHSASIDAVSYPIQLSKQRAGSGKLETGALETPAFLVSSLEFPVSEMNCAASVSERRREVTHETPLRACGALQKGNVDDNHTVRSHRTASP